MSEHAKLSASGSERWILCPGSVKAEEGLEELPNRARDEGEYTHELAAKWLKVDPTEPLALLIPGKRSLDEKSKNRLAIHMEIHMFNAPDMVDAIYEYKKFVWERMESTSKLFIEQKINYSHIVPDGFGTLDAALYSPNNETLHIIDFKYGKGDKIYAYNNSQLLLYALGMIEKLIREEIEVKNHKEKLKIFLHIVQPRLNHYDTWEINYRQLVEFGEYVYLKAQEAMHPNAPRIPSERACKYCKAKSKCGALYNLTAQVIEMQNNININPEDQRFVLDNSKIIRQFIKSIEDEIYYSLSQGGKFEGYKLVKGKSYRVIDELKESELVNMIGEKAYKKSLIGIGELEKLLDKKTINSLIYYEMGKPILVKEDDPREIIDFSSLNYEPINEENVNE